MVVEIPDETFDFEMRAVFGKMPQTDNGSQGKRVKSLPVLHRIAFESQNNKNLCVVMVTFYKAVFRELDRRNIIKYDPNTDTWQGVDYHGD